MTHPILGLENPCLDRGDLTNLCNQSTIPRRTDADGVWVARVAAMEDDVDDGAQDGTQK